MSKNFQWILNKVAKYTNIALEDIDVNRPFMELGFDSQSVVRFIGEVEVDLGIKLDPTALINYPNVNALFHYLNEKMQNESVLQQRKAHVFSEERVAVTGMSCRFPEASNTEQFFSNLYDGVLSVTSFPSERSALCGTENNFQNQKFYNGGYIRDIELFDNAYFNISAEEAAVIDPQQRLLMQEIVHAFEDADISADDIANNRIGVFVGVSNFDYLRSVLRDEKSIGSVIGNSMAMLSNRMSFLFDLRGPSLTIDTACSSSLVAVSAAVDSIRRGDCDIAIAAGVNLIIDPEINRVLAEAGMLSPDGLCHTFDQKANGYVRGEGVGVVVLRGLSSARCANNRIYAEIDMCLKLPEEFLNKLDLSSVRVTVNGSELVRNKTLNALAMRMQQFGLNPKSFNPSYGLAENTLVVSSHAPGTGYKYVAVDERKMRENIIAFSENGLDIVSCGRVCCGMELKIIDLSTQDVLGENRIGEIWIAGDSVAAGYWSNEAESGFNQSLPGDETEYYATGDLGFMHEEHLYIVGRKKDVIIIRGKNLYSQDIEELILHSAENQLETAVAFAIDDHDDEQLIVIAETNHPTDDQQLISRMNNTVVTNCGIIPAEILLKPVGYLVRTNSGKVQRQACKKQYLDSIKKGTSKK